MRYDSRLSSVLHVLVHMAEHGRPMTSEEIAGHMQANPVQIRRTLAGLRRAGFVRSEKGHGGGWSIACELAAVSLRDVHAAIGAPGLFAIGNRSQNPSCLVEQATNAALGDTLAKAEQMVLDRFGRVSLADLSADFQRRAAQARKSQTRRRPCST